MPKKKRNCSLQRPTLTFVPSPDEKQPPVLTPEFAVHNPITAKSVQVDDQSLNTWVSPQFRFKSCLQQTRARLPSQGGRTTQSLHKSKSFNETLAARERNKRYKQLQFVNYVGNVQQPILEKDPLHGDQSPLPNNLHSVSVELVTEDIQLNTPEMCLKDHNAFVSKSRYRKNDLPVPRRLSLLLETEASFGLVNKDTRLSTKCSDTSIHLESCETEDNILTPLKTITTSNILAPDTPETDYGMPLRKVQLKYGLRDKV
ncbi:hypothetical protein BgiBS90_018005 [Biomphalaria glabrata]|nr:hypothetical protein BgiBS90_018005 [Biomphalaria glabrata]